MIRGSEIPENFAAYPTSNVSTKARQSIKPSAFYYFYPLEASNRYEIPLVSTSDISDLSEFAKACRIPTNRIKEDDLKASVLRSIATKIDNYGYKYYLKYGRLDIQDPYGSGRQLRIRCKLAKNEDNFHFALIFILKLDEDETGQDIPSTNDRIEDTWKLVKNIFSDTNTIDLTIGGNDIQFDVPYQSDWKEVTV